MVFFSLWDSAVEYWCKPLNVVHDSLCVSHILEVEAVGFNEIFVEACRGGRLGATYRLQVEARACRGVLVEIRMGVARMRLDSRRLKQGVDRHRVTRFAESILGKTTIEVFVRHDVIVAAGWRSEPVYIAKLAASFLLVSQNLRL